MFSDQHRWNFQKIRAGLVSASEIVTRGEIAIFNVFSIKIIKMAISRASPFGLQNPNQQVFAGNFNFNRPLTLQTTHLHWIHARPVPVSVRNPILKIEQNHEFLEPIFDKKMMEFKKQFYIAWKFGSLWFHLAYQKCDKLRTSTCKSRISERLFQSLVLKRRATLISFWESDLPLCSHCAHCDKGVEKQTYTLNLKSNSVLRHFL